MTLTEKDGRWLCRKSPKAKTVEDVTDIIVFDGDFCSLMGKAGRTEFHAYLHKSGNRWLQMYGVTSLLGYWGEKEKLVQWAVDRGVEYIKSNAGLSVTDGGEEITMYRVHPAIMEEARTAHKRSLNEASALGTDVHAECEAYIKKAIANGGKLPGAIFEGSEQARLFMKWAEEEGVQFLASEKVVYSKRLWTAGTLDFLCLINGKLTVGDVKTSNWISPKHFLQCGAYASFYEEMSAKTLDLSFLSFPPPIDMMVPSDEIEGIVIVQLPRSGGIKVVTNTQVGVGITELKSAFEMIVSLVKLDRNVSTALYS
jgi:hypothetical protein